MLWYDTPVRRGAAGSQSTTTGVRTHNKIPLLYSSGATTTVKKGVY